MSVDTSNWFREEYPRSLIEAVVLNTFLCYFGYEPGEIAIVLGQRAVLLSLHVEGHDEVFLFAGEAELSPKEMEKKLRKLIKDWNSGESITTEEKKQLWRSSRAIENKCRIIAQLALFGLRRGILSPEERIKMH